MKVQPWQLGAMTACVWAWLVFAVGAVVFPTRLLVGMFGVWLVAGIAARRAWGGPVPVQHERNWTLWVAGAGVALFNAAQRVSQSAGGVNHRHLDCMVYWLLAVLVGVWAGSRKGDA